MASLIVSDQSGNLSEVPEEEFHGATGLSSYGYSVANPQQIQEFKEQQEYNAPLKQAESLGVGALSGATAGLSNVALDYSGIVPKEEQEKLSKYNPTESNIVGPALGIGGSLLIPGGGAVGAISKLGRAGEEAVSQVIPRGTSLASKIISSAASKGVGSAIEAAAYTGGNVASESMLGDPKLTAEAIAQEFGLSLAIGGGLGGILGTAEHLLPASLNLAKSSMGKLRDFAFGTGEGAEGGAGVLGNAFADVAAPVSGIAPETITAKIASRMAGLEQTEKDAIVNEFSDEMQKTVNSLNSTVKTFNSEIKPQEKVNLLNNMDDYQKGVVANQLDTISQHAKNVISQMRDNPEDFKVALVNKLERSLSPLNAADKNAPADIFTKLNESKQAMDEIIPWDKIDKARTSPSNIALQGDLKGSPEVTNIFEKAYEIRNLINESLRDANTWGDIGVRYGEINEALSNYYKVSKPFTSNFVKNGKIDAGKIQTFFKLGDSPTNIARREVFDNYLDSTSRLIDEIEKTYKNVPGESLSVPNLKQTLGDLSEKATDAQSAYKAAKESAKGGHGGPIALSTIEHGGLAATAAHAIGLGPVGMGIAGAGITILDMLKHPINTVAKLAQLERQISNTMAKIDVGVRTLVNASIKASYVGRGYVSAGISADFSKDRASAEKTYNKRVEQIQALSNNPQMMQDNIGESIGDLSDHAENTTAMIHATTSAGIYFLSSKILQVPNSGILSEKWTPSHEEINKFTRYYQAVNNPLTILKQAAAGTLTKETIEAVQTVYPALYQEINKQILDQLSDKKPSKIPYQTKIMLSMITGQNMVGALNTQSFADTQSVYQVAQQQQNMQEASQKASGGAKYKDLTLSNRSLTNQQRTSERQA